MLEFKPVGGRLLVKKLNLELATESGIILSKADRLDASMFYGEVLAVGDDDTLAKERGIKVGSLVEYAGIASFPTGSVSGVKDRNNETSFLSTGDVLAVSNK